MKYLIVVIALALVGCGGAKIVSSTEKTVVVSVGFDGGVSEPLKMADNECKKRGMNAVVVKTSSQYTNEYIFECVR